MPEGRRWNANLSCPTLIVCPALEPPLYRAQIWAWPERRSISFPLPWWSRKGARGRIYLITPLWAYDGYNVAVHFKKEKQWTAIRHRAIPSFIKPEHINTSSTSSDGVKGVFEKVNWKKPRAHSMTFKPSEFYFCTTTSALFLFVVVRRTRRES